MVKIPQPTDDPNDPLVSSHGAKRLRDHGANDRVKNWSIPRKLVNASFVLAVTVAVFAA